MQNGYNESMQFKPLKSYIAEISNSLTDDKRRIRLQFSWTYLILGSVAGFMTLINIATTKIELMVSTLIFSLLCFLNRFLSNHSDRGLQISRNLFSIELIALFVFFIVSGTPEGFSVIWVCMLPTSGLLLFGRKRGSILCAIMFVILIFLFQTAIGNSVLQYSYTASFKLRFPMLYAAFYCVSFLLETIRTVTQLKLADTQKQYEYLYLHDALTGIYNRYGFNQHIDLLTSTVQSHSYSLSIIDIDHFKNVNDTYGHFLGDDVLKTIADTLCIESGSNAEVCRWGGEEFAILLKDGSKSKQIAEHLLTSVQNLSIPIDNHTVSITVSIGTVIVSPDTKADPASLVMQADACLYQAKENGRNQSVIGAYSDHFK